jgi:hypothetical protein
MLSNTSPMLSIQSLGIKEEKDTLINTSNQPPPSFRSNSSLSSSSSNQSPSSPSIIMDFAPRTFIKQSFPQSMLLILSQNYDPTPVKVSRLYLCLFSFVSSYFFYFLSFVF